MAVYRNDKEARFEKTTTLNEFEQTAFKQVAVLLLQPYSTIDRFYQFSTGHSEPALLMFLESWLNLQ